jgi:hypothetical protein
MNEWHTAYNAVQQFSARDKYEYDPSIFHQWYRKKKAILEERVLRKQFSGGAYFDFLAYVSYEY